MSMLEELWNGNVPFGKRPVRTGSKLEDRLTLYARNDKVLKEMLSDSQREQYQKNDGLLQRGGGPDGTGSLRDRLHRGDPAHDGRDAVGHAARLG